MHTFPRPRWVFPELAAGTLIAALLAGCDLLPGSPSPSPSTQVAALTPEVTETATLAATGESGSDNAAALTEEPVVDESAGDVPLVVWAPEILMPSSETPGGQTLLDQITAFDEMHPGIPVEFYPKLTRGPGSAISYLRSARPVAPGALPDLVLLSRESLVEAAREQLIVPVGPLLDRSSVQDLYPVAEALGTVDGQLVGLPFVLEVQHTVYRETLFEAPPNSFDRLLQSPVAFQFPAGPRGPVNLTVLTQYMAAGGALVDADGAPMIDEGALRVVLSFYVEARERGVVDPVLFQIVDPAETWSSYRDNRTNLAVVTSTLYLLERDQVRSPTGLTWTATPDGQPYALATGWSWAIVTTDPARQEAALALIDHLMTPTNQGAFSEAAAWLPSQRGALEVWGSTDRYASFAHTLLNNSEVVPDVGLQTIIGAAIQDAFENVVLNGMLPLEAASSAAQSVNSYPAEGP